MTTFRSLFAVLLGVVGRAAHAAEPALGELGLEQLLDVPVERVTTASRYEQGVNQVPASVTIVTADQIRTGGYRTLAEILRGVGGVYVANDRNYINLGIRGFQRPGDYNTRVLLLIDGHRLNDNLYDSAMIGMEGIVDVDLIERIEVIRGPGSSIYGSNAIFGVINVITRDASTLDGIEAGVQGGAMETYQGRVTFGEHLNSRARVMVSASLYDSAGHDRLYFPEFDGAGGDGVARGIDAEDARRAFGRLAWGDWTLAAAHAQRTKQVPTASFGTVFNDEREVTTDETTFVDLAYRHAFGRGEVSARAYYDRYAYTGAYPYDFGGAGNPDDVEMYHDDHYGDGAGLQAQLTQRAAASHTVTIGGELRRLLHLSQTSYIGDRSNYDFRDQRADHSAAVYAQDEWALADKLLLNFGGRYDDYRHFGGLFSPRVGLIYNPTPHTAVKLIHGRAHRTPNAYELYRSSTGYRKTDPDLGPESITNDELVVEHRFAEGWQIGATAYRAHIKDLISDEIDPADGLLVFRNRAHAQAHGLELELRGAIDRATLGVSYALQRTEDHHSDGRRELENSPRHMAKLRFDLPVLSRLHWNVQAQYLDDVATMQGTRVPDWLVVDTTLFGRELMPNLDASLSVYNLLDESYAHPASGAHTQAAIPQDGRSARLTATYRFGLGD